MGYKRKYKRLKAKYNKLLDVLVCTSLKLAAAEEQKVISYNYIYKENE